VFASVFVASGLGMLWLGRYLIRGLRFLFSLVFDWLQQFAQSARRKLHQNKREGLAVSEVSLNDTVISDCRAPHA